MKSLNLLSPSFGKYNHLIVAYITKDVEDQMETDMLLDSRKKYFVGTGLQKTSVVKLHRLITVTPSQIGISIGILPEELIPEVKKKLQKVFELK